MEIRMKPLLMKKKGEYTQKIRVNFLIESVGEGEISLPFQFSDITFRVYATGFSIQLCKGGNIVNRWRVRRERWSRGAPWGSGHSG